MKPLYLKGSAVCLATLFAFFFATAAAFAASVSGTISDANGNGLGNASIQVRLWEQTDKGFSIAYETLTAAGGAYSFSDVAPGNYKLNARMAPGFSGHYGDTWYDVEPPSSNGLFGADADVLTLETGDVLTGLDITLPFTGGFHGAVTTAAYGALGNVWVRSESTTDFRYHHNTLTKNYFPRVGQFSFRGLRDNHAFRLLIYDPYGTFDTLIVDGPLSVTNNTDYSVGTYQLPPAPADPNEPNNNAQEATAITGLPFASTGARIFPRGFDVDWYCLDAAGGDRLLARAESTLTVAGQERQHPWIDPIMSFWTGDGTELLLSNDDDPNAHTLASFIDTGIVDEGRYCFVVSMYGDQNWTGTGQQSAGPYTFSVEMGNRRPLIEAFVESVEITEADPFVDVLEGEELVFDVYFDDPDGDPLTLEVIHLDSDGQAVTEGTLSINGQQATYNWTLSMVAAQTSPYEIRFIVDDGEFTAQVEAIIQVEAVNRPPTTPTPLSPVGGVRVDTHTPVLSVENATDPDGDALTYEFELHAHEISGEPDQRGSVVENPSGTTSWTAAAIEENATVYWRVRAYDGAPEDAYSPWSTWQNFMVDTVNDPPETPMILKPSPQETVLVTTPRISSNVPVDPEGDAVFVLFEVAEDAGFDYVVATSEPVAAVPTADTVGWTVSPELQWATRYHVRARARDEHGAESDWSIAVSFTVRDADDDEEPGDADGDGHDDGDSDGDGHQHDGDRDADADADGERQGASEGCGCAATGSDTGSALWFIALMGLAFWYRRRSLSRR